MHYIVLFLVFIFTLPTGLAMGQTDGGVIDGGVVIDGGIIDGGGINGGNTAGGGGGTAGSDGSVDIQELSLGGDTEDTRNQGFVGATSFQLQATGFIGASSETSGPPLSTGTSFGGGVNDSGVQATGGGVGGAAGGGGNGGGLNGGFGGADPLGAGTENGFQVIRSSVRARLVPQINAPQIPNGQIVSRFQNRFSRQPVPQSAGPPFSDAAFSSVSTSGVNVQVENRTAVLTGVVGSPAERDRWERQLRLEPGIYQINNQIQVSPTFSSPGR